MNKYRNEIAIGSMLLLIFAGAIFWFARHESGAYLKITVASLTIIIAIASFTWKLIRKKRDLQAGAPAEDEFTELAKLHAGSQAFMYSMWLWFVIFIFHTSFQNQEEMLGIGILGSVALYGLCLWYYRATAEFAHEK